MKSWKTLKTKIIEQNKYLRFLVDTFVTDSGQSGEYFYHTNAHGDNAVGSFVQKDEDTFIMIREYRYLYDRISISQTQGSVELGEAMIDAAKREVIEETGYEPKTLIDLGWFATAPSFSKEKAHVFLARDLKPVGQKLDEIERIETIEMTIDEIDQAIESGQIWDGQVVAAWYRVKAYLSKETL